MKIGQWLALSAAFAITGCATTPSNFTPADPELMQEWQVEGVMEIVREDESYKTYFTWTQFGDKYKLEMRPDSTVGPVAATLRGTQGANDVSMQPGDAHARSNPALENLIKRSLPLENFSFWLRGLPATEDAKLTESGVRTLSEMQEGPWHLEFGDFMHLGTYQMPEEIAITGKEMDISLNMVRGEPGFLTTTCFNEIPNATSPKTGALASAPGAVEDAPVNPDAVLEKLVPSNGQAPLPKWVNDEEFCAQLKKLHGKIPDPRIGLYGPDSMMWKLSKPLMPGAWGSGRALLLQTAHPWVTAGIDEHSIVREDPMLRARRTFNNILTMTFGSMPQVMASANLVHKTHNSITGEVPYEAGAFNKHSEYRANEVNAMIWVHATLWDTLVMMYEEMEAPLTTAEKERFYEETKLFAMLFGIPRDSLPPDWESFMDYNRAMWNSPQLTVTPAAIRLKEDLFDARSLWLIAPLYAQEIISAKHLPTRVREGYGMDYGFWEKLNYGIFKSGATVTGWLLPETWESNPVYLEAQARLKGERVGFLQRRAVSIATDKERLVN